MNEQNYPAVTVILTNPPAVILTKVRIIPVAVILTNPPAGGQDLTDFESRLRRFPLWRDKFRMTLIMAVILTLPPSRHSDASQNLF